MIKLRNTAHLVTGALIAGLLVLSNASAPAQDSLIFEGPIPLRLGEQQASLPVEVYMSPGPSKRGEVRLHGHTRVSDLKPVILGQLRQLIANKLDACELRLSVADANPRLQDEHIILAADLEAEIWICTNLLKTRVGRDSFTVELSVLPKVRDGRIQLEAGTVAVSGMDETVAALGGDLLLRPLFSEAVERFNRDERMTRLPDPIHDAGFRYDDITAGGQDIGADTLRVSIIGPNDLAGLIASLSGLR